MTIPPFNEYGLLPPGVHVTTLSEIEARIAQADASSRRRLITANLRAFIEKLVGLSLFRAVIIDGSFVTDKLDPGDVDVGLELKADFAGHVFYEFMREFDPVQFRSTFLIDSYVFVPGGPYDFRAFFQYVRESWAIERGAPQGTRKGVLEIPL